ncbi:HHL243Wp [Eremothecium sinecaudum]|uniref:Carbon catabolite-derepressing protein kinase n=1 Tax=Eremothecium sinecaudum TaxID=45286 RepID=A0A0X8HW24_9SACH|nr:HHL243Wp [Eremothecium sinecaudum]AMD22527.1 HHL243Wp [Eremothecium sinecaudum]
MDIPGGNMQDSGQSSYHHHKYGSSSHPGGQGIGKYQVIKTLGEGSFGKVKLAYHVGTGQKVALKIINKKVLAKSDMQGRIEREISYLRLLRHPHIIKLYDVMKSNDEIIMVIEYAGNELFDYIVQRDKMSENEARRFFQQIISAVEYCHRHKIVHRDLKPENLLLDEHLNVKIADFGLSNIMTDGNFLKTSCGSPNYAAPEVISGKLYAGPEVDVWSSGVILYVMLCRRLPFDDESIPVLFKNISNGVYTIPKYLSAGASSLIKRMLIVNPLNRITIHGIMEDEWFKVELPDYLTPVDLRNETRDKQEMGEEEIDESLVKMLTKTMSYDTDEIYEALESANETDPSVIEIRDAYLLIKENKSLIDGLKLNKQKSETLDTFLSQSPPTFDPQSNPLEGNSIQGSSFGGRHGSSANHHMKKLASSQQRTYQLPFAEQQDEDSTIAILPSSLPQIHRANMVAQGSPAAVKISPLSNKKSKSKWHFGIRSRSYPLDVMGEIYLALKHLGAEWAKPSEEDLWTIRVRWKYKPGNQGQDTIPDLMKMVIQLFQIETNNYLVDFKFDGWESSTGKEFTSTSTEDEMSTFSAYPFLHLTTRLIMELAVNSQNG